MSQTVFRFSVICVTFFAAISLIFPEILFAAGGRFRIVIVDSYNPEYLWSRETAEGVARALVDFKFLDNKRQADELNRKFSVESSRAVIRKEWMDTIRRNTKAEIADVTATIVNNIKVFRPDLILLGDDNAANYIGNHFVDTEIPVVFWGINGTPVKYGLADSAQKPGHNVTGIYQPGYIKETLELLLRLAPSVKSAAVLSDDSTTGRARVKVLQNQISEGLLPVTIKDFCVTNSYQQWKKDAEKFAENNDAFIILNHNTLRDDDGRLVGQMEAGNWYLTRIKKPDCSDERQFVLEGILLVIDDSGFTQSYEAVRYANKILNDNTPPGVLPIIAPKQGHIILNRRRAAELGIHPESNTFIEEFIDGSLALDIQANGK